MVGTAAATGLRANNWEVVEASRSTDPSVDVLEESSISGLFERTGQLDAIVITCGATAFKPIAELTHADYRDGFASKALAQIDVVRIGTEHLSDGGSFTLTSGILSRLPIATGVAAAMANGAIDAFVMAAATELPRGIRINAISPTVLANAPSYHSSFPGFVPVPSEAVGAAYVRSVLGVETGKVIEVDR